MKNIFIIAMLFAVFSCNQNGFQEAPNGLEYRFIEENTEAQKPNIGDGLVIDLKYTSAEDSLIFEGPFRVILNEASHKGGSIEDAFAMMHKGDSAEFLIDAENFIRITTKADIFPDFVEKGSKLKFYVRLKDILSPETMAKMKQELNAGKKAAETMLLDDYIEKNEIKAIPTESGLYIIKLKETKAEKPQMNDTVEVHYTGMFLDETIFDSSIKRNESFKFVLGQKQVIPGWDEGVAEMRKGEKFRLIIPSFLAYGQKGYSDLIAPYTTLMFDIELIDIK